MCSTSTVPGWQWHPYTGFGLALRDSRPSNKNAVRLKPRRALPQDAMLQDNVERLKQYKPRRLRIELAKLGIKHDDCFEKTELVMRLAKAITVSETPVFSMPMRSLKSNNVKEDIIVPLKIQDQSFNFLVDTGCSTTFIRPEVAWNDLKLPRESAVTSAGMTSTGSINNAQSVRLDSVALGTFKFRSVTVVVFDLSTNVHPSVAGIMGLDLLSQVDVEFDFPERKLAFFAPGSFSKSVRLTADIHPLATSTGPFGLPYVQVAIGNSRHSAVLDLASSLCVISTAGARQAGLDVERSPTVEMRSFGVQGSSSMPFQRRILDISLETDLKARLSFESVEFAIGDLPAFEKLNVQMVLGANLFRRSRLLLSISTGTTYMSN